MVHLLSEYLLLEAPLRGTNTLSPCPYPRILQGVSLEGWAGANGETGFSGLYAPFQYLGLAHSSQHLEKQSLSQI